MNDTAQQVEDTVREAIESGEDIYQKVRTITLKALTERELDRENIDDVVKAVGKGISSGMNKQYDSTRNVLQQSTKALDDALASTAEATKLAVEEASSRMENFSQTDLKKSMDDLKGLEEMFLDTIADIAKESGGMAAEVAEDFFKHMQIKGTAVGRETKSMLESIKHITVTGESSAVSTARDTAATLAKIGSGILAGIAESLQPEQDKK
ncbi:DUF6781 family protein [Methylomarinum vadi]|uniref:DUF6781 family protein n=1 Tax=Methylomarinum vadi TaxID=438855 RepID=UPI001268A2BF|nr:DUF6781 family protein [Methylomarinum vadi]